MVRVLCLLMIALLVGCNGSGPGRPATFQGKHPIRVVATTGMVADAVKIIGGPWVEVQTLLGPGIDPHTYKPSTADVQQLAQAHFLVYNGLHLEGKMDELFHELGHKIPSIALAESLPKDRLLAEEDGITDPHVWFDVKLWADTLPALAKAFGDFDPAHATDYQANAEKYRARLLELDQTITKELATIPAEQRVLITSHDAFRYFGRAYQVEVRGVQGISTEAEASVKDIQDLVRFITDRKVKAVFVETSVNPRNMEALLEGSRARQHTLKIGGELYSDALGPPGSSGETYEKMIRYNVDTIVQSLR